MAPGVQIVLSGCLTFGVPLVMACRELWVLRRPDTGSWRPDPEPAPPPVPKPLPECLIPRPTQRARVPELV